jgi:hypothetical protein
MKRAAILAALALALAGGCGGDDEKSGSDGGRTGAEGTTAVKSDLPQGSEPVDLDPANFTTEIDNPYWPMRPGARWVFRSSDERIEVTVTDKEKKVEGVDAVVLRDVVKDNQGELVEVTDDWYAQDTEGNVWYLGEDTKEYKNGKVVSTAGTWESGVDGAEAGIIIPAKPRPGLSYRQEYYEGEAEDSAKVLAVNAKATVPFGTFDDCLKTEDTTPLEPSVIEHKYYARDVGPVLRESASGGGREELVEFRRGGG